MLINEVFALRDGERIVVSDSLEGATFCVMARSVTMPGDPYPVRDGDGAPVEAAAVIACRKDTVSDQWKWVVLSMPTKEWIGDIIFDNDMPRDTWLRCDVTAPDATPPHRTDSTTAEPAG